MAVKKYNIEELAKKIGVSKTLISFVLNNKADHYGVSKATQKKVLEAIKKTGFRPSFSARMLRLKKSNLIGVLMADISNPFFAQIATRIEQLADIAGYRIIMANTHENPKKELDLLESLIYSQGVDGVILTSSLKSGIPLKKILPERFPLVLLDRKLGQLENSSVGIDNFDGSLRMTTHLATEGAKKIGLLVITPGYLSPIRDRIRGYTEALSQAGIENDPELIREISFQSIEKDVFEALSFFHLHKKVDGLFVLNNQIAKHCLLNFEQMNIRIPHDMLFASFDDNDLFSLYNPSVSAVMQPVDQLGHKAFGELSRLISLKDGTEKIEANELNLTPELIIRQSSRRN